MPARESPPRALRPPPSSPTAAPRRHAVAARHPGSLRIGLVTSSGLFHVQTDCVEAVEATGRLLEDLGHRVEPTRPPALDRAAAGPWFAAGIARDLDRWSESIGDPIGADDVEPMNWMMAEVARAMNAAQYVALEEAAWAWARGSRSACLWRSSCPHRARAPWV